LSGLMSRCTMPIECRRDRPVSTWRMIALITWKHMHGACVGEAQHT
jgi:hypothetical protein